MKTIPRQFISISIFCAIFFFIVNYFINHLDDLKIIKNITLLNILLIQISNLAILILNGIFMNITISPLGINLSFREYTSISVLSTFGNIFLPFQGGMGLRAIYLKSRHDFSYTLFISTLAGNYIIIFNVISIVGLIGMSILYFTRFYFNIIIFFIYILMFIASTFCIFFYPKNFPFIPFLWIKNKFQRVIDGWLIIKKSIHNIIYLYIVTIVNFSISVLITYFEFKMLNITDMSGFQITLMQSLFISLIMTLSLFTSITPASLGIKEGLVMLTSQIVNIAPSHALAVTILDRVINFSLLLTLAYPASYFLKIKCQNKC